MEKCSVFEESKSEQQVSNVISIMFGGFPHRIPINDVKDFMENICRDNKYTIIKSQKKKFRGFAFIHVNDEEEALNYTSKDIRYQEKILDVSIAKSHDEFIKESLLN